MSMIVLAREEDFLAAIDMAESASEREVLPGLASPTGAAAKGLAMQAWDAIRSSLEQVWTYGARVLDEAVASATATVDELLAQAGDGARDVRASLTAQLQIYVSEHIERSLRRVRGTIEVEGESLHLKGVAIEQSVQLSGSLKASISEVLALTAQGQLLVTAEYGP